MKINVGDKVLMRKVEGLPEEVRVLNNMEGYKKFAGKICTVSEILTHKPNVVVELEEDDDAKGEEFTKCLFMSAMMGLENPMTKKHHFSENFIEKVVVAKDDNESKQDSKQVSKHTFGWALEKLKNGKKVAREGWNGKGLWLELQKPDAHSKMTLPYVYLNYPEGDKYHDGCRVPWLASQTDMLEEDWVEVE